MKIDEIRKIMLGHSTYNFEIVIITPLKSTYKILKERLKIEEIYESVFFENFVFKISENDEKGLMILSPQGIASKDIIELFDNTNIIFFGLAGSLNNGFEIGKFVEVKTALNEEKDEVDLYTTGFLENVKCGYSPCLLGNLAKKYCDYAKNMNCDVVDMETAYCAKTAIERNNRFTSLLLISDIPDVISFWEIPDETKKKLKESRIIAVDKIISYINIFARKE